MHITHLSLTNFRNYGRLELAIPHGSTLLYGQNAQGKTNLLEAIYYLATTRSAHATQDAQLLNWEAVEQDEPVIVGRLVAQLNTAYGVRLVELRLIQEKNNMGVSFRREALVDRRKVRLMDLLGHLRVVQFLPEDVQLITGAPAQRRRYLDITLCQVDTHYCRTLSQYNKLLEQRNALLKQIGEGTARASMLEIYDARLAELGAHVLLTRAKFMQALGRVAQHIYYEELTGRRETIRLHYLPRLQTESPTRGGSADTLIAWGDWLYQHQEQPSVVQKKYESLLAQTQSADIGRGSTHIGPHRDDWWFWVNGRQLASYGSRGQQRSAILALKMAEIEWMAQETGDAPILLFDEVVAELDEQRRACLLTVVQKAEQSLLTATDPEMFTESFLQTATMMHVVQGQITVR